jgi:hypothetical protein
LQYQCGAKAANELDAFIARISLDRYGRTVATCLVGGADIGDWLVRSCFALDWPEYSKGKYGAAEREAEQAGRGIWAGSFVEPWLYRVCIREGGKPHGCSEMQMRISRVMSVSEDRVRNSLRPVGLRSLGGMRE